VNGGFRQTLLPPNANGAAPGRAAPPDASEQRETYAAAETPAFVGTEATVFRICEAIW
jgi:hypothetical protein